MSEPGRLAALAAERVADGLCPECGHQHLPAERERAEVAPRAPVHMDNLTGTLEAS